MKHAHKDTPRYVIRRQGGRYVVIDTRPEHSGGNIVYTGLETDPESVALWHASQMNERELRRQLREEARKRA